MALVMSLLVTHSHGEAVVNGTSTGSHSTTPPLSGCQVCALNDDCTHAYLDGPGQFCGEWLDHQSQRQRCCCPLDTACKVISDACNCSGINSSTDYNDVSLWVAVLITVVTLFAVAGVVGCCCWCCCRPRPAPRVEGLVYGSTAPMYSAPTVVYGYGYDYDSGDSRAVGFGVGAALLGGMLVGAAIAGAGDSRVGENEDGNDGGEGGDF